MTFTAKDDTAQTIRFYAKDEDGNTVDATENFETVDGKRVAEFKITDTVKPLGVYEYQLIVTYPDSEVEKLPAAAECESDDCAFPTLTICESLELGVS